MTGNAATMEPISDVRTTLKEHLKVLSASPDQIVIQAEATGTRSTLLMVSLILSVFGVVALVGALVPAIQTAGLGSVIATVGGLLLVGSALVGAVGYWHFRSPILTVHRASDCVELREGNRLERVQAAVPAFGIKRFATYTGLHMASLHLNLKTSRTLVLATSESDNLEDLQRLATFLDSFAGQSFEAP